MTLDKGDTQFAVTFTTPICESLHDFIFVKHYVNHQQSPPLVNFGKNKIW